MILMICHVFTKYSIGKRRLRPNPRQQNNKNMNFNDLLKFLDDFQSEKGACGRIQSNKTITNMNFHDFACFYKIFNRKKVPANESKATKQ